MLNCGAPCLKEALYLHSPHQVELAGRVYPTAWHAYAAFLLTCDRHHEVADCRSPEAVTKYLEAALAGQEVPLSEKLGAIEAVLRAKLDQHPFIWDELLSKSSGMVMLLDENDSVLYGGRGGGGQNYAGQAWEKIRDERLALTAQAA
jgi:predicted NAD-dependent protein-ADP-ribosyltransferase YbiA (DUF1768 family)